MIIFSDCKKKSDTPKKGVISKKENELLLIDDYQQNSEIVNVNFQYNLLISFLTLLEILQLQLMNVHNTRFISVHCISF